MTDPTCPVGRWIDERIVALEKQMAAPGFWDDQERAHRISAEHASLQSKRECSGPTAPYIPPSIRDRLTERFPYGAWRDTENEPWVPTRKSMAGRNFAAHILSPDALLALFTLGREGPIPSSQSGVRGVTRLVGGVCERHRGMLEPQTRDSANPTATAWTTKQPLPTAVTLPPALTIPDTDLLGMLDRECERCDGKGMVPPFSTPDPDQFPCPDCANRRAIVEAK